jgi:hypothetical protein
VIATQKIRAGSDVVANADARANGDANSPKVVTQPT